MHQMKCAQLFLFILLQSTVISVKAAVKNVTIKVNFNKTQTCPSNSSLSQLSKLVGAIDSRSCFSECALKSNCSVVFRASGNVCYFGSREQLEASFSPSNNTGTEPCESYVRTLEWTNASESGVSGTHSAPTAAPINLNTGLLSKLIILFDFRRGYTNLANPLKFNAAPHGSVTQDSQGAHFPGGSNLDYIEVDTDGNTLASTYMTYQKPFTFFAKVHRRGSYQTYHNFYDCTSPGSSRGQFFDNDNKLKIFHPFASGETNIVAHKAEVEGQFTTSASTVSVAAVFNGNSLSQFFVNGAFRSKDSDSGSYSGPPLCLRLGFNSDGSKSLKGMFVCYAVAQEALTQIELEQLEEFCAA